MTVIATLLVIAFIGFVITIGFIIAVALNFRKVPTRIKKIIGPSQDSALELVNTGKGIAEIGKIRYDGYLKHGTRIVNSVKSTSEEVGAAAKTIDVAGATTTFKSVAASINAAQEGLAAAKAVLEILNKNQKD